MTSRRHEPANLRHHQTRDDQSTWLKLKERREKRPEFQPQTHASIARDPAQMSTESGEASQQALQARDEVSTDHSSADWSIWEV